jgi:hypothetical protein
MDVEMQIGKRNEDTSLLLLLFLLLFVITFMQGIYTHIPVLGYKSCSYSIVTIHGTCNSIAKVKYFVLLH